MDYNFFDYKYNIAYNGEDFFGPLHIGYIITSIVVIILLTNYLRKKDKKIIDKILLYSAIFLTIEEITKISWESYWDINTERGFNVGGILPLETCSIFMYCLWTSVLRKDRVRNNALTWMSSIGIVGGLSYIVFTNALKWYPFFTYGAFHSMIFHFTMAFIGVLIVWSGYCRFENNDIFYGFIPQLMMASVVVPLDYIFNWDYMLLHYAGGVPIIEEVGKVLTAKGMPFLTTILMLIAYFVSGSIITLLNIRIQKKLIVL